MTDDTGQYSDPISDFPDSPSISTRASNVIKRYTSSFSINSKKSKNNDGSTSISATSSPPDLRRKTSLPSLKTAHFARIVPDSQVSLECASTSAFVADEGMEYDSDETSSVRTYATSKSVPKSHTPTQSLPRVKTTLPIPDISTQQILDEDEIVQDRNSFNDVHCDLTELLTSNSKQFIIEANTVPELLRSILKDNACHEISKICNEFAEDCTIILNDNDPNITIHQEVENQGEMNAGMDVDEGNIPNIIDYGPNHTPGATATHIPRSWADLPDLPNYPLELTTSTFFQTLLSIANDIKTINKRIDGIENRNKPIHLNPYKTISTQPIPETKNDMSTPTNSTNPPARKNLAQIIKDKMNSKPTELVPAPNIHFFASYTVPQTTPKRGYLPLKSVAASRAFLTTEWALIAHSNPSAISQMEPEIRNALGLNNSGSIFTRDTKWSKVIISGVPTGFSESNDDQVISKTNSWKRPTATGNLGAPDADTTTQPTNTTKNVNCATTKRERKGHLALTRTAVVFAAKITNGTQTNAPKGLRCQLRVHSLLNDKSYLAALILMIQDPWWGRIGYDKTIDPKTINIYGTTNSPFWMCFSPPGISGPKGPGVSIYVRRDIPGLLARYSDSLPPHPDVLAVDVIYNGSLTTLVNVYIHGDNERYEEALNHLICHPYPSSHPIVIAGDFNAHHPNWALEGSKWRGQSDSIIDLTLLNSAAVDAFEDFEWTCEAEGAMGSDHNIISWTISSHIHADGTTDTEPPPNFVIDLEIEDDWTSRFDFLLSLAHLPLDPKTPADLESMANGILQAMTQATQDTMPQKKQGKRGSQSPWWSSECSKALRELKHPSDSRSRDARRAALRGAIRRARKSHADKVCKAATVGNIFRYTNWYKGKRRAPLPPIRLAAALSPNLSKKPSP
ncbi:reverse transcriptase [Rhizoctonia solani]|uniref:Reverse transcriptase n=1 Tax=Rhizoctonia solani TaxID=456999 RepID=A0A8H7IDT1_9AGAM|nr:reverse transcriptase [Rhizoctonia solani]